MRLVQGFMNCAGVLEATLRINLNFIFHQTLAAVVHFCNDSLQSVSPSAFSS
jgi:hypothetical protein